MREEEGVLRYEDQAVPFPELKATFRCPLSFLQFPGFFSDENVASTRSPDQTFTTALRGRAAACWNMSCFLLLGSFNLHCQYSSVSLFLNFRPSFLVCGLSDMNLKKKQTKTPKPTLKARYEGKNINQTSFSVVCNPPSLPGALFGAPLVMHRGSVSRIHTGKG